MEIVHIGDGGLEPVDLRVVKWFRFDDRSMVASSCHDLVRRYSEAGTETVDHSVGRAEVSETRDEKLIVKSVRDSIRLNVVCKKSFYSLGQFLHVERRI
jgi:hypothetical protein